MLQSAQVKFRGMQKHGRTLEWNEWGSFGKNVKELFDACLQRTLPLLKVLNLAQKDDTTWLELIEAFEALITRLCRPFWKSEVKCFRKKLYFS